MMIVPESPNGLQGENPVKTPLQTIEPTPALAPAKKASAIAAFTDQHKFTEQMLQVGSINPDTYARATALSRASGIPAQVLNDNVDELDKIDKSNEYSRLFVNSPKTAQAIMAGGAGTQAIVQNDIGSFAEIERASGVDIDTIGLGEQWLNAAKAGAHGLGTATSAQSADDYNQFLERFDSMPDAQLAIRAAIPVAEMTPERRAQMRLDVEALRDNALAGAAESAKANQALPDEPLLARAKRLEELGQGGLGAMFSAAVDEPGSAARTLTSSLVGSAPIIGAAIVGGLPAAALMEFNTEYSAKLVDVLGDAGVDTTDPKAMLKALQDDAFMADARQKQLAKATVTTAIDTLGMGIAGKLLAPAAIGGKALSEGAKQGTNLVAQVGVQTLGGGLSEGLGQLAADGKVNMGDVALEMMAGGVGAPIDVAVFGKEQLAEGLRKSRQARATTQAQTDMVAGSLTSGTREKDPATFRGVVADQLAGNPLEMVWIPAEALQSLNQSGVDVEQLLANVPGLYEQYTESLARGGSVTFKNADYLTYMAEYNEQLGTHVRHTADGFSAADSIAWTADQETAIDEIAAQMREATSDKADYHRELVGQLLSAGYSRADAEKNAALQASAINTLATRSGKTVEDVKSRFDLSIANRAPDALKAVTVDDARIAIDRLRSGDVPKPADMFGKSLTEYLTAAGGLDDTGGELAGFDADVGKVGRNRLARKGGQSMDTAALAAFERGYFPGMAREDVTPNMLVDALREEAAGNPRYSVEQENATLRDQEKTLNDLQEYLDRLGVDIQELSTDEVLAILKDPESMQGVELNQFAGPVAVTANQEALAQAKQMLADGVDAERVRKDTGWFIGADGKPRFEIADGDAKLTPTFDAMKNEQFSGEEITNVSYREAGGLWVVRVATAGMKKPSEIMEFVTLDADSLRPLIGDKTVDKLQAGEGEQDVTSDNEADKLISETDGETFQSPSGKWSTLGEVIAHERLFDAYPSLKNMKVVYAPELLDGAHGAMSVNARTGEPIMVIGDGSADEVRKTVLHETQHAIQAIEGFAQGGSVKKLRSDPGYLAGIERENADFRMEEWAAKWPEAAALRSEIKKLHSQLVDKYGDPFSDEAMESELFKQWDSAVERSLDVEGYDEIPQTSIASLVPFEVYERLAGEVEARTVENRSHLSERAAQMIPPSMSADTKNADAIVSWGGADMYSEAVDSAASSKTGQQALTPDQQRLVGMTEDEYIAAVNPSGDTNTEDGSARLERGDLTDPENTTVVSELDGGVTIERDQDGNFYARQGGDTIAEIINYGDEVNVNVLPEARGKGVAVALAAEAIKETPFFDAGSLTPGGDAVLRAAFRKVKAELQGRQTLNQSQPQTETEAFKRWFGDSKVVDADGKPLVVYHGTGADVTQFNTEGRGKTAGAGAFFSTSPELAATYATGDAPNIVPTYLNIRTPAVIDAGGANWARLGRKVKVTTPAIEVSDQFDEDLLAELEGREPQKGTTKKLKAKSTTLGKLFADELVYDDDYASTDDLARWAKNQGYDGVIIKNVMDHGPSGRFATDNKVGDIYVAFRPEQIKSATGNRGTFDPASANILEQAGEEDARGSITFTTGANRKFQITLSPKRDMSTLLHEFGHYYLEVLTDLAADKGAPAAIVADVKAIRTWVGAEEGAAWTTEQHEQFARGFELYLAEGKAPSPELTTAFAHFKRWIINAYKDLRRLNVELTPEIRAVMSRIIATDEQIEAAEEKIAAAPMFESAAKAGMSEAEWASYVAANEAASQVAASEVERDVMREETLKKSRWWNDELKKTKQEVAEEVDLQPEYAARRALRTGIMPDGSTATIKMNSAELRERYGVGVQRKLMAMHATDGVPIDIAAQMIGGFSSGDEMVKAMLGATPRQDLINQEANARMEQRHGAKVGGEAADRAMEAVHNERRVEVMQRELTALAKVGNRNNTTSQQILKEAARRIMLERKVRDVVPYEYQRSEQKAGRDAYAALVKGDLKAAYAAKQQQLLNFYLWREAIKARESAAKNVAHARSYMKASKQKMLGKAGHDYQDQINTALAQYEFSNVSLKELGARTSYGEWYTAQVENGLDPYVPVFMMRNMAQVNYKDLTVQQLNELTEFLDNVNQLAKLKTELQANKHIRDVKEAKELMAASAYANVETIPRAEIDKNTRSLPKVMGDWLSKANSSLMKMEQVIEWLDGGDANGAWSTIFYQPLAEAQHKRDDWNRKVTMQVVELTNKWMTARGTKMGEVHHIASMGQPITTNGMLAVALNVGNEGNRTKLMKGYGWNENVVAEILGHMTKEDWQYVADMWEAVESLWPAIAALEKQVNGIVPPKVQGIDVHTPFGVIRGGYWPLVYDPMSQQYADVQKGLGSLAPLGENGTVRATPARGFTQARVDGFSAPIVLDVGVIGNHLNQVVHDLTHRVALADAHKLITGEVREAMNRTIGPDMAAQFANILDGIASDQATGSAKSVSAFSGVMNALRINQAVAWMGYSVTTILNQQAGYAQALDYFASKSGRKFLYRGMVKFWAKPIENLQMIREMSGEMRNRAINLDASIREAQTQVTRMKDGRLGQDAWKGALNSRDLMAKYAFVPIQVSQSLVDGVVWMGAYEMAGGFLNHEESVNAADRAVRLTQTAGGAKDMATIQQNILAKMFMPVYGYSSLLWNRNVDIARSGAQAVKARDPVQVLVAFERFVYLNLLPSVMTGMIKGALPDDDDDSETWAGWLSTQALLAVTAGIPLIGQAAQGAFSKFGYGGASTIGQGFDNVITAGSASSAQSISTNAVSAIGAFTGLPSSQINRAVKTGFMLESGEMEDSAGAIMRAILFGPPNK